MMFVQLPVLLRAGWGYWVLAKYNVNIRRVALALCPTKNLR
jgi:hypothetical protein